ncbi:hypothetical protein GJ744_006986, partial [Endocarpon pusillum]
KAKDQIRRFFQQIASLFLQNKAMSSKRGPETPATPSRGRARSGSTPSYDGSPRPKRLRLSELKTPLESCWCN